MRYRIIRAALLFFICSLVITRATAQLGKITIDLEKDKPQKFKTKVLKSEKTGQRKFTIPRKIIQNTASHFNYYFNAKNKLNAVIDRARYGIQDNYVKLLPFYGYSLDNTAAQKTELDSIIYKATAGILLHDLRTNWVDNFYLLIGKAYLLKKDFDSAAMTFQFINYNLYPRKKKDEDQMVVGTNTNGGGSTISIANKETPTLLEKTFTLPPSRNDALVWQIRTLIETEEYPDAAGLINTLQNDANFPSRLRPDLEEVNAYWFYRQGLYDSTAIHLERALNNSLDLEDKARWEFLLAQLFEINKNREKASEYYGRAMKHTTNPLLDIYANLNNAKMYNSDDPKEIDHSIAILVQMSKRDKYENYRDLIFYSAAELASKKPDTLMQELFLKKSLHYNETNISLKNQAFLQLAELNYHRKNYRAAYANYDSLQMGDPSLEHVELLQERKSTLAKIVSKIIIIEREDSLQKIAMMPLADREAFVKKLARKLGKERGLKDEEINNNTPTFVFDNLKASPDLFAVNNPNGDWYFYNASLKSRGYSEFRSKWGKRANADNWRRSSAIPTVNNAGKNVTLPNNNGGDVDAPTESTPTNDLNNQGSGVPDITYEGMINNLPVTPEKIKASNALISASLFELGKLYQDNLEDYQAAVETYESSLQRFPDSLYGGEIYMNLSYCYQKLGDISKSAHYKNLLLSAFKQSKFAEAVTHPGTVSNSVKNDAATTQYQSIYNLFIEGRFDTALQLKKVADSLYTNNYWSPQLLYIEAVYYIKQKQDSQATSILNNIINLYPASPLSSKATVLIDVLKRRKSIEDYLGKLQIERAKDEDRILVDDNPVIEQQPTVTNPVAKKTDSVKVVIPKREAPVVVSGFSFSPEVPHLVVMLLDKVDPVYINEAKNAFNRYNREKFYGQTIEITKNPFEKDRSFLLFNQFKDADAAVKYAAKIKNDSRSEISWLPAAKYSFFIISASNLEILQSNKDLQGYLNLLHSKFPVNF
ncbi:MAG: tetratricopeptide repeat protein [Ginsengibacter sp.]